MKIDFELDTKYKIDFSSKFRKQIKKLVKQNKDIDKLLMVITLLANKEPLGFKYKDHQLVDDKYYKNCRECHVMPNWLLIYRYEEEHLILILLATGSHSDLFN